MAQIRMFWDESDVFGNPTAGLEVTNFGLHHYEIPKNACGFRLEKPGGWDEHWHFTEYGIEDVFEFQGIQWSAEFIGGPPPDFIEARGPVHGCDDGPYEFQTPLGALGITGDDPVFAGAGSFIAEFFNLAEITWLDSAGNTLGLPSAPPLKPDPEPPKLPKEFFEPSPDVKGCFRDFEGNLHCPEEADTAAMASGLNFITSGQGTPPRGVALLVAAGSGIIPQVKVIAPPGGHVNTSSISKVEVDCPAELILTATFHKAPDFAAAEVKYRFRFAHGPVSTVFSILVDGHKSVTHSVPIPLPPPIGQTPSRGGVPHGSGNLAVVMKPPGIIPGGTPSPQLDEPKFQIEALPANEHKGAVRVEVVNVFQGIVASNWNTYHLICREASRRPVLRTGLRSVRVHALQVGINRWLRRQQMPLLKIDGIFGPRTEAAVRTFQRDQGLEVDGIVGLRTWKQLLTLRGF